MTQTPRDRATTSRARCHAGPHAPRFQATDRSRGERRAPQTGSQRVASLPPAPISRSTGPDLSADTLASPTGRAKAARTPVKGRRPRLAYPKGGQEHGSLTEKHQHRTSKPVVRPGDQATSRPTTTDAKWGQFRPSRWGQCKSSFRPLDDRVAHQLRLRLALAVQDHVIRVALKRDRRELPEQPQIKRVM